MGLFSSKSSSKSSTSYTDNSLNLYADLSSGDLGGSDNNTIAGGSIIYDTNYNMTGISEDLASKIFGTVTDIFNTSLNWVGDAIYKNNTQQQKQSQQNIDFVKGVLASEKQQNQETLDFVKEMVGTNKQQTEQTLDFVQNSIQKSNQTIASSLQTAYNSEQATISSMKTYALYALIGFLAWSYFGRAK